MLDIHRVSALFDIVNHSHESAQSVVSNVSLPGFVRSGYLEGSDVCFYRVSRLSFDEDYPHREAFENVLLSLDCTAFNFVYILSGSQKGIELYIGVARNANVIESADGTQLQARDYGAIIEGAFAGNFGGSTVERLKGDALNECVYAPFKNYNHAGMIVGIPSENTNKNDSGKGFQGIDRLINSMLGLNWRLIVVAEPVAKDDISAWQHEVYRIYNQIAPFAKSSVQKSASTGTTHTEGESDSTTKGASYSRSQAETGGKSSGESGSHWNSTKNSGWSTTEQSGTSESRAIGSNKSDAENKGQSQSMTAELINKNAQELLKYMDEELLERIKLGFGRGMFKTSVYYMADYPSTANRLKVGIKSLFQGDSSSFSPLEARLLDLNGNPRTAIRTFQNVSISRYGDSEDRLALLSYPHDSRQLWLSTWLTPNEVSLLAGLPQKEIPGISVVEGVDFGLNARIDGDIILGRLMQKGRRLEQMPLALPKAFLSKHIFIAGVTGSGKTTTCHKLLKESDVPFMVIEPAKTEYRTLIKSNGFGECLVFTVGDEETAPLRFNPFELVEEENLSSHIDMLKATFISAFPMEGSMPQLLEEAIYKCYEDKGWNPDTSRNDNGSADYPIFSDFLDALNSVVKDKSFSDRLRDDYIGSLVSRFSNLRKGAKGRMLNTSHSFDFAKLAETNVIIELENLKSAEDKALVMGFILARMSAVIRRKHRENRDYRHITLIEEAHRLLAKVEYGDSGSKKSAVETFTDLLAEVRKYGEGLIVVDQIPNKLAPEVIKNTNTKIIHKILARDDKETVGDAMLMDDKQKSFLSALETGQAVVFTEGLDKPVHISVDRITDTNEAEIPDETVREQYEKYIMKKPNCRNIWLERTIIRELFEDFNRCLLQYIKSDDRQRDAQFADKLISRLNEYNQVLHDAREREAKPEDIYEILVQERTKRANQNAYFYKKLMQLVLKHLMGTAVFEEKERKDYFNVINHLKGQG